MAANSICTISDDALQAAKKFRFRKAKNIAAISMKADATTLLVTVDETFEDVSIEDIAEELPTAEPRLGLGFIQIRTSYTQIQPNFLVTLIFQITWPNWNFIQVLVDKLCVEPLRRPSFLPSLFYFLHPAHC